MKNNIENLLRIIAFCFICLGAVRFTYAAFEIPIQSLSSAMLPAHSERAFRKFDGPMAVQIMGSATQLYVGVLLLVLKKPISYIIGTSVEWPLALGRAVIVVGGCLVLCEVLNRSFTHIVISLQVNQKLSQPELWFDIIRMSVGWLPLVLLWPLTRRILTGGPADDQKDQKNA